MDLGKLIRIIIKLENIKKCFSFNFTLTNIFKNIVGKNL